MTDRMQGPLAGVRVLDLGTMIAGPVAATLLADFGADVIKIEQPDGGDPLRSVGPAIDGDGLYWNVEARNKRSVTVDMRQPDGQEIVRSLAKQADVVIENFRPGTLEKWGLSYKRLNEINPKLIVLSISGYGQTGPYASRAAYDRIALAFSGFLNMTGYPDRPPVRPGTAVADYQSALMGAFSVMIALFHRDARGGAGQHIDQSLYETMFRFTDIMITAFDRFGTPRERRGNLHFAAAPGDHFETNDGRYLVITVAADQLFVRLCEAMGRPELAKDERYSTHPARWARIEEVNGLVGDWIKSHPVAEVCARLDSHGLAYSLVYSPAEIIADPHYAARESFVTVDNPRTGPLKIQAPHPRMSGTPAPALKAAPALGADTDAILSEMLGYDDATIAKLRSQRVI